SIYTTIATTVFTTTISTIDSYTLSLHDALPILNSVDNDNEDMSYEVTSQIIKQGGKKIAFVGGEKSLNFIELRYEGYRKALEEQDRKSTRLNSSHVSISYAVFC